MSLLRYLKISLAWLASILLLLPVFLAGLLTLAVSAATRYLARVLEPKHVAWRQLMQFDPELGWRPKPNLDAHYLVKRDDVYHIVTDEEGWPRADPLGEEHDVVVIGDSYAFGFGIDTGSSFADRTDTPKVKAIGANGYSMVQGLILMRQLAHRLSGKMVVWFVYVENDLYDNIFPSVFGYRTPFARNKNGTDAWEIASDHVTNEKWVSSARIRPNMDVLAELCTPSPLSDRIYSACRYLIEQAAHVCRDAGAELVVMAIPNLNQLEPRGREKLASRASNPDRFDATYPETTLAQICRDYDVQFVAGSSHLEAGDYKVWERWHWNSRGHARVAGLLRSIFESRTSKKSVREPSAPSGEASTRNIMAGTTA